MNIDCQPKRGTIHTPSSAATEQADAKDAFIDEEEEAAAARLRHLADIGGGDRHLAAEADAFDRAQVKSEVKS